jgi:hypothetical protein
VGTAGGEGFAKAEAGVDLTPLITANTWHNLAFTSNGQGLYNHTYLDGNLIRSLPSYDSARYYPEIPLLRESQDGYNVTASGEYGYEFQAFEAFNHKFNAGNINDAWLSPSVTNRLYSGTGNLYAGNVIRLAASTPYGEWIKIEMPHQLLMTHILLAQDPGRPAHAPEDFKVYGSNNDVNWTEVLSETGAAPSATGTIYTADDTTRAYKYFAMVVTRIVSTTSHCSIGELRYFGHRVNDLVRFPGSTTVRKFPDTVMVSNGPQRGYTVSASSTQSSTYEVYNIFHLDLNKEWRSDTQYGSGGAYTGSRNLGTGAVNGEWVKIEMPHKIVLSSIDLGGDTGYLNRAPEDFKVYGSNDDTNWTELISETGITPLATPGTNHTSSSSTAYKYFALVVTRTYTTFDYVAIETLVFNGTEVAEPVLARLGGSFEGKIANTRVYDRSIGERQVLEVWDAEKDRFGRGESSITVHKGRLGVGTKTPQATLDVRGNIFGPLLTHRSYVWRKPGIIYVPASQECRILAQVVEIPEMYKNISPLNLRLSYKWTFFGESSGTPENMVWRTSVKHSGNTVEHMNTGMEGNRPIGVTNWVLGFTIQNSNTPDQAFIPGSYQLKNVTGDTIEIGLDLYPYGAHTLYVNRGVSGDDNFDDERGCSTLTVFMEPY